MGISKKEKNKAYRRRYYLAHKAKWKTCNMGREDYQRAYYLAHRTELNAKSKAYQLAHAEAIKAKKKAYYLAHLKERKAYRLANKHKIKAWKISPLNKQTDKAYRLANKKERAEWQKKYRQKYPEKGRVRCRKHRALKRGNNHEPYTDNYIFERDGWICGICGRKINKRLKRPNLLSKSIDHIIPLSKGGSDAPINVQAAHLRCNMIKQAQSGGQLRLIGA